jgi:DNA-binding LacI/PurR family transcriptional regulator
MTFGEGMRRRPTSADVARVANVSRATVSYVLNNTAGQSIPEVTRIAVLEAARRLDYRPNMAARSLAAGSSSTVLCIVPRAHLGEMVFEMISAFTAEMSKYGYTLAVYMESENTRPLRELVKDVQPLIAFTVLPIPSRSFEELSGIDVTHGAIDASVVRRMNEAGVRAQVQHLVARGHRVLGYAGITEPGLEAMDRDRSDACIAACEEFGLTKPVILRVQGNGSDAGDAVSKWRSAGVTAVCAYNDEVAFVVQHGIRINGLTCPADLAVVGIDAIALGSVADPPLTTVAWKLDAVAREMLVSVLESIGARPEKPNAVGEVAVSLVEREST